MNRTLRVINCFSERFVQRTDVYARQAEDGKFHPVRKTLGDEVIHRHLIGELTLGLYPYSNSTTKWICVDIDTLEPEATRRIRDKLNEHQIPHLVEFSGKKGFHIWIFVEPACSNRIARTLGKLFADGNEVFPKQDTVTPDGIGNLIKSPLGKHRVTQKWCLFVDEEFNDLEKPYEELVRVQTIDATEVLKKEFPNTWKEITGYPISPFPTSSQAPSQLLTKTFSPKDCIQHQLLQGVKEGKRNATAIILATELRNQGAKQIQVEKVLLEIWNPKNQPPLPSAEIRQVVNSAFNTGKFEYGCKPEGSLRQTIQCHGYENCTYYTLLRTLKTGTQDKPEMTLKKRSEGATEAVTASAKLSTHRNTQNEG